MKLLLGRTQFSVYEPFCSLWRWMGFLCHSQFSRMVRLWTGCKDWGMERWVLRQVIMWSRQQYWGLAHLCCPIFSINQPYFLELKNGEKTPNTTNLLWGFCILIWTKCIRVPLPFTSPLSFLSLFSHVVPLQPEPHKSFCSSHWLKLNVLRIFSIDAISQAACNAFHTPQQGANKIIWNSSQILEENRGAWSETDWFYL